MRWKVLSCAHSVCSKLGRQDIHSLHSDMRNKDIRVLPLSSLDIKHSQYVTSQLKAGSSHFPLVWDCVEPQFSQGASAAGVVTPLITFPTPPITAAASACSPVATYKPCEAQTEDSPCLGSSGSTGSCHVPSASSRRCYMQSLSLPSLNSDISDHQLWIQSQNAWFKFYSPYLLTMILCKLTKPHLPCLENGG
jgi:hypothetical protein